MEKWRQAWREGGVEALRSKGSPGRPKLNDEQFARLEVFLKQGPLVRVWEDQRWTLTRVKTLIGRKFRVGYTVPGVLALLKRRGWLWHSPPGGQSSGTTVPSGCGSGRWGRR